MPTTSGTGEQAVAAMEHLHAEQERMKKVIVEQEARLKETGTKEKSTGKEKPSWNKEDWENFWATGGRKAKAAVVTPEQVENGPEQAARRS